MGLRNRLYGIQSESGFQKVVLQWFKKNKIYAVKYNASGISQVGVPDILACIDGYFVGIELKKETGVVSEIQKYTIRQINKTGLAIVLRPSKFEDFKLIVDEFIIDISRNRYAKFKNKLLNTIGVE